MYEFIVKMTLGFSLKFMINLSDSENQWMKEKSQGFLG